MDFTELIRQNIQETAARRQDAEIVTAEGMIPLMDDAPYPRKCLDVVYAGRSSDEKLDIYYPGQGDGPFPVLVEVHGGAWYFGQKRSVEFEPFLQGLSRGFACVSLGYTLSPKGHYPLPVLEIKSAIRFLRANAGKYRLDPARILLWGGSAGAHLAALAAASCDTGYLGEDLSGNDAFPAKPDALALWYGCFDYYENGRYLDDWIYKNFFGTDDLESIRETIRLSSPLAHLTADACPIRLFRMNSRSAITRNSGRQPEKTGCAWSFWRTATTRTRSCSRRGMSGSCLILRRRCGGKRSGKTVSAINRLKKYC